MNNNYKMMMMMMIKYIFLGCFTLILLSCSKEDDIITVDQNSTQPTASNIEIDLGNLVGFWNFNSKNGMNSIPQQCGDWELQEVDYEKGHLISKPLTENVNFNTANSVIIDASEWSESKGINRFKYFSGAIRFKVSATGENPLLSFGLSHRFLHISLEGDKVHIAIPDVVEATKKHYISTSSIKNDTWHVLYYRVEEFNPAAGIESSENNILIQLDNQPTETFNYGQGVFYKLYNIANFERVMSFGNLSNGKRFKGECDWVMLSNGRMTPGNTQYHLKTLIP